jgi:ribosome-binding ATPase YchF (GTP1/OBG family)
MPVNGWIKMTVFRVDVEKDVATVVKELKSKDIEKATDAWGKSAGALISAHARAVKSSQEAVKYARRLYTIYDNRLKDPALDPAKRKAVLETRKAAYDFTMSLKNQGLI